MHRFFFITEKFHFKISIPHIWFFFPSILFLLSMLVLCSMDLFIYYILPHHFQVFAFSLFVLSFSGFFSTFLNYFSTVLILLFADSYAKLNCGIAFLSILFIFYYLAPPVSTIFILRQSQSYRKRWK